MLDISRSPHTKQPFQCHHGMRIEPANASFLDQDEYLY